MSTFVALVALETDPFKLPLKVVEVTEVGVIVVLETPSVKYNPLGEVTAKYPVAGGVTY